MYVQGQWAKEHIFNRLKTTVRSTADKKINIRNKTSLFKLFDDKAFPRTNTAYPFIYM